MANKKDISVMRLAKSDKGKKAIICVCIFLSEFFGTFMLMFIGCMGVFWGSLNSWMPEFQFTFVLSLVVQVWMMVSGSLINPAITLGAVVYGVVHPLMSLLYIVAEILGAISGYSLLKVLEGTVKSSACITVLNPQLEPWQGMIIEFCLTGAFMLSLCAFWDPRNEPHKDSIPVRLGFILTCVCMAGSPLTSGSINPARSLGPAIYHNEWKHHWIYWVGPIAGTTLSALFYRVLFRREQSEASDNDITTLDA